ncbi:MAG: molybdopterin molybdotransferase MoeA [Myxococcales bacterium]|nr:molybdopterin molybdotransferase MoeA [Myxococcales bacterium]
MLSYEEALARMVAEAHPVDRERVPFASIAGRVLAHPLTAREDLPPFDYSAMDGYALDHRAALAPGAALPVAGARRAGDPPGEALARGQSVRIFTGAPLPPGADAVVMQEEALREGDTVRFTRAVHAGQHVRRRGEDLVAGAQALPAGARVSPWQVALGASCDRAEVEVFRHVRVGLVLTGDELRAPGSEPRPGSVVNSIGPALEAWLCALDARVSVNGPYVDDVNIIADAIGAAVAQNDLVITVGGVSVGDHDPVKPALVAAGVALDFWKVAIKPGKPLCYGRASGAKRVLGLPGNPASALLTFGLFGVPVLRAMAGLSRPETPTARARLAGTFRRSPGRTEFVRVRTREDGRVEVLSNQSSGAATSFAWGDAVMVVALETAVIEDGAEVTVMPLDAWRRG